ncbi:MAG: bifunctional transcriptional activator/DNA repair enzyme AdaA [Sphingomonadales bacterium]
MGWHDRDTFQRWLATQAPSDGAPTYFGVITTGIYCRPHCPARPPLIENVRIFKSLAEAEAAGMRPCKRCRPRAADGDPIVERVTRACHIIAAGETAPRLAQLGALFGLSGPQFQRSFTAVLGLSPQAYWAALRKARLANTLQSAPTITQALYEAGFGSAARFYASAAQLLGMSPAQYRSGGQGETVIFTLAQVTLGWLLIAATGKGVCMLALGDRPEPLLEQLQTQFAQAQLAQGNPDFDAWCEAAIATVEEPARARDLPLDIRGTAFQQRVWKALQRIPPGETRTYADIAAAVGAPSASRAVGTACGANPLAVAIPCHRVLRGDGGLGGYRWGLARKKALLSKEKAGKERKS